MKLAWPLSQNRVLFKRGNIDSGAVSSGADAGSLSTIEPACAGGDGGSVCCERAGTSAMAQIKQTAMNNRCAFRPHLPKKLMVDATTSTEYPRWIFAYSPSPRTGDLIQV